MVDLKNLKFTKTHEWLHLGGTKGTVGITHHAQEEISDVVFVELPKAGKTVAQGEEVAVVESVKAAFSIYAPVGGTVTELNEALRNDPGLINSDPYEKGWIYRLDNVQVESQNHLLSQEQYEQWVRGEGTKHN